MKRALTRRDFSNLTLGLLGSTAALALAGCGGDDADDGETGGGPAGSGSADDDGSGDDGSPTSTPDDDDGSGPGDDGGSSAGDDGVGSSSGDSGPGSTGPGDSTGPGAESSSGEDSGSGSGGAAACDSLDIMIQSGHPHELVVPPEDVAAGVEQEYTITGLHTHTVTLTPEHFSQLAAGRTITVQSSVDVHSHMVTITCA